MNPTLKITTLLLLVSSFFYVNGAPEDSKLERTLQSTNDALSSGLKEIGQTEKNVERPKNISSENLDKVFISVGNIINQSSTLAKSEYPEVLEAKDMKESIVPALVESAEDVSDIFVNTTSVNDMMKEDEKHATLEAKIFFDFPDKIITDLPTEKQRKPTHDTYLVGNDETKSVKVSGSGVDIVSVKSTTMESLSIPTVQGSFLTLETREEMVERKNEKERMPTGVVALISAIGFAAIAIFAYFGSIVWKRYREYLHGHRELLVNDFDSNDINNFEL